MDKQNNKCNKLSTDGMLAMKTEYFNRIASIDYEMYSKNEEGPINPKECAFFEELKSDERITGLKAENDCTYYTIIGKAKEIDICLQLGLYGTALTSAITLPDTCGLIMKCRESTGSVRDRYEKWFEEYVLTNSTPSCDSLKKWILQEKDAISYAIKFCIKTQYANMKIIVTSISHSQTP